tara:strand:+ start:309 stop:920 length:612 start_codon:yes stop_codon:yes gene_type:complete
MFSGLIEAKPTVLRIVPETAGIRLVLQRPESFEDLSMGASIAVQGCCLTIVAFSSTEMEFQAGEETLSKTTLRHFQPGDEVNCERALALGGRLGGHLVTGHVDGTGKLRSRSDEAEWSDMVFESPPELLRQMASKASITVDGVSLTLVDVTAETFSVALIPHTLQETSLGNLACGSRVNLETDLLAKYVQRQLQFTMQGNSLN